MLIGISNIILDLGGVILDIDFQESIKAFQKLGINLMNADNNLALHIPFLDDFEKGLHTEAVFYDYIRNIGNPDLTNAAIESAWNAMLLQFPLRRLQILQQLQLHYNTFLLSNTNVIHERAFNKMLKATCGFESLGVFFDKVYYSHRLQMRKPDAAIFEMILNENGLIPSETLFVDDSLEHLATAQGLGILTIHLTKDMRMEHDIFKPKSE